MNEGEKLICIRRYDNGSMLLEHRNAGGYLLAIYIGYYRHKNKYQLYPAGGERHNRITLAGKTIHERAIQ